MSLPVGKSEKHLALATAALVPLLFLLLPSTYFLALAALPLQHLARQALAAALPTLARLADRTVSVADDNALHIFRAELHPTALHVQAAHAVTAVLIASTPLGGLTHPAARAALTLLIAWRVAAVAWALFEVLCVDVVVGSEFAKANSLDQPTVRTLLAAVRPLWATLGALVVLENIGVNVSAVAGSLGIGGIAVAMASNQFLSDLIAAFTMLLDRTVRTGDYVCVKTGSAVSGTVVSMGWKSTRILSPDGHTTVVANADMAKSRILKFPPVASRREVIVINVDSQTPLRSLESVKELLEDAVKSASAEGIHKTEFTCDLEAVYLKRFDPEAYVFEVVIVFEKATLAQYRHGVTEVNLAIASMFVDRGVRLFAIPYKKSAVA
jgi:small-conductance mechanosensitive channel